MKNTFIDEVIVVNASIDSVFSLIGDINNWPSWCDSVRQAKQISRGNLRKGSLFYFSPVVDKLPSAPLLVSILSYQQDKEISWGLKIGRVEFIHSLHFRELPDGRTEVHHQEWCTSILAPVTKPLNRVLLRFNQNFSSAMCEAFLY